MSSADNPPQNEPIINEDEDTLPPPPVEVAWPGGVVQPFHWDWFDIHFGGKTTEGG